MRKRKKIHKKKIENEKIKTILKKINLKKTIKIITHPPSLKNV